MVIAEATAFTRGTRGLRYPASLWNAFIAASVPWPSASGGEPVDEERRDRSRRSHHDQHGETGMRPIAVLYYRYGYA